MDPNSTPNQLLAEINPAVMISAVIPTYSRPIENYPQRTFMLSFEPDGHAKRAVSNILLHEIEPAVIPFYSRPIGIYPQHFS
jgi:hypothetical protein